MALCHLLEETIWSWSLNMPICVWSWKFHCRNLSLSQNRVLLNFLSFAHNLALQTLSRSCRERWNDGCAHRGPNAELKTEIDKRGKENMGMERLIASCEDYRELGINWQESDDDRLKEEMKKQRCSSLLPLNLSSSYLIISLLASWQLSGSQTTICLLERSE